MRCLYNCLSAVKIENSYFSWNLGVSWADIALVHSKSAPVPLVYKNLPRTCLRKISRLLSQNLFPSFRLHKLQSWERFPWGIPLFLKRLCQFNNEVPVCFFFLKHVAKAHYPVLCSSFEQLFTMHKENDFEEHGPLMDPAPMSCFPWPPIAQMSPPRGWVATSLYLDFFQWLRQILHFYQCLALQQRNPGSHFSQ